MLCIYYTRRVIDVAFDRSRETRYKHAPSRDAFNECVWPDDDATFRSRAAVNRIPIIWPLTTLYIIIIPCSPIYIYYTRLIHTHVVWWVQFCFANFLFPYSFWCFLPSSHRTITYHYNIIIKLLYTNRGYRMNLW